MTLEANVLNAIVNTMTCDKCPYPCEAKENSSFANCAINWSKILSKIDPNTDWKETRYKLSTELTH